MTARVHVHTQTTSAPSHQCAFKLFLGFHFSICFCCCKRTSRRLSISSVLYSPVATIGVHPVVCAVFCRRAGVPVPTSPDVPIACFETCPQKNKWKRNKISSVRRESERGEVYIGLCGGRWDTEEGGTYACMHASTYGWALRACHACVDLLSPLSGFCDPLWK